MTRIVFHEISARAEKSGKCQCGKRSRRKRRFYQTVNPFNKTADGKVKGRDEIIPELQAERAAWLATPVQCVACEEATIKAQWARPPADQSLSPGAGK